MSSTPFPQRKIGTTPVSSIGLGCMSLSIPSSNGLPSEDSCLALLTAAADAGINLWVTSDWYGPFHNETLIGKWFAATGRRDEIFLVTKFGFRWVDGKPQLCGKAEHVRDACAASLERLQTDRIDLYCPHRIDPGTPIEETVAAMVGLKDQGKVMYLGLSECSATTLRRAHKVHAIAAVEMEYSPFALEIEDAQTGPFLDVARELGVKILAYSPLGRGFLTGAIKSREDVDDLRRMMPRFSEENFGANLKLAEKIVEVASEKGCKPGQLALAWVLAQGDDFIPLPGTKHIKYLQENAGAVEVQLTGEDEQRIREVIAECGGRKGERYPAATLSMCFGDSPEL